MAVWKLQMPSRPSRALAQVHLQDIRNASVGLSRAQIKDPSPVYDDASVFTAPCQAS